MQHVSGRERCIFLHRAGHIHRGDHRRIVRAGDDNSHRLPGRGRIGIAAVVLDRDRIRRGHRLPCTEVLDECVAQREVPVERMHTCRECRTRDTQRGPKRREQSGTHRSTIAADSAIEGDMRRMRIRKIRIGENHGAGVGQKISWLNANVFLHGRTGINHGNNRLIVGGADLNHNLLR